MAHINVYRVDFQNGHFHYEILETNNKIVVCQDVDELTRDVLICRYPEDMRVMVLAGVLKVAEPDPLLISFTPPSDMKIIGGHALTLRTLDDATRSELLHSINRLS